MLKKIIFVLLTNFYMYAIPSGFFVGGNFGGNFDASLLNEFIIIKDPSNGLFTTNVNGSSATKIDPNIGIQTGYFLSINNWNAFKFSLNSDYRRYYSAVSESYLNLFQLGLSADYFLAFQNRPDSIGLFIGGGYDFSFGSLVAHVNSIWDFGIPSDKMQNSYKEKVIHQPFVNFGLYKAFGKEGQMNLSGGVKLPFGKFVELNYEEAQAYIVAIAVYPLYKVYLNFSYTF